MAWNCRLTSRIKNIQVEHSCDQLILNTVTEIDDIVSTKARDSLTPDRLAEILSCFSQAYVLFRMPNLRDKFGLLVICLVSLMEIHGYLYLDNIILNPFSLTEKKPGNIRKRTGVLLLHICDAAALDLRKFVTLWERKTATGTDSIR